MTRLKCPQADCDSHDLRIATQEFHYELTSRGKATVTVLFCNKCKAVVGPISSLWEEKMFKAIGKKVGV